MKKFRLKRANIVALAARAGGFLLKSHLFTIWLGLCILGFWVGTQARPARGTLPSEELFENLQVVSYRETPSDTAAHFVVELAARGRAFRQYDVDSRRFEPPAPGHDYWRSISGTRYPPLQVRGHVSRGFWLELPDSSSKSLLPEQFDELYSTTLDFVKPLSIATTALGLLSGYSVGYRLGTWGGSLSNPSVQARVLATPGIGRAIAREAWRRVALEPAVVFAENDAGRFASVKGRQRLYTNFFRLAADDSNGFIPYEVARLESTGCVRESRAMDAFARAVRRAAADTCDLASADFGAVEEWASLLDRRGHWAVGATPPPGGERLKYLGTLAWYGVAPEPPDERRIWVGPRLLVRNGGLTGFVADEVPLNRVACPVAWQGWLGDDDTHLSANAWTAQWMGDARQFAPIVSFCMGVARAVRGTPHTVEAASPRDDHEGMAAGDPYFTSVPAIRPRENPAAPWHRAALADSLRGDTTRVSGSLATLPDSAAGSESSDPDSLSDRPQPPDLGTQVIRATIGGLGR